MQCSPVLSDGHKSHLSLLTQKVCAKWFEVRNLFLLCEIFQLCMADFFTQV